MQQQAETGLPENDQENPLTSTPKEKKSIRLPYRFASKNKVLLALEKGKYKLYYCNELPAAVLNEVAREFEIEPVLEQQSLELFEAKMQVFYSTGSDSSEDVVSAIDEEIPDISEISAHFEEPDDLLNSQDDAPIIRLLNAVFFEAIRAKASDIHIQPYEKELYVRFRLDGVLRTILKAPIRVSPLVVSRIKVLAKLDIAEKRVPQDGRISVRLGGRNIDLRISTLPSAYGERVVMRLLDKGGSHLRLTDLGMPDAILEQIREIVKKPHGMFLVTGPTGSGKTTTLYASLEEMDREQLNIMTVEDPVEYYFDGISQTQVNSKADMTFSRGLRAILRQDPDVVMIGEIRDVETASIAIQSSLTGHLVLSTLHTNTALGAITRLIDMGIEPFLLASTVHATMSQRLIRKLCGKCKKAYKPTELELDSMSYAINIKKHKGKVTLYRPQGCEECFHTGFNGRVGIYELVEVDNTMRELIHNNSSEAELVSYAHEYKKIISMRDSGFMLVLDGVTTYEEVLRVSQE